MAYISRSIIMADINRRIAKRHARYLAALPPPRVAKLPADGQDISRSSSHVTGTPPRSDLSAGMVRGRA